MALRAGATLTWNRTALDRIWPLNPLAHQRLARFGKLVGIPFLALDLADSLGQHPWLEQFSLFVKRIRTRP
jgi:hypothetical protein